MLQRDRLLPIEQPTRYVRRNAVINKAPAEDNEQNSRQLWPVDSHRSSYSKLSSTASKD